MPVIPWGAGRPREFLRDLAMAVDSKADYFPGHSDQVAYQLGIMAREAGWDRERTQRLQLAGLLHDVGKLYVPDSILLARRRLEPPECDVIRLHPEWGAKVVARIEGLADVAPWILHHHEHYDGSGYPDGLAGDEIPIESRMILVADAYSVMTVDRPYRRARRRGEAVAELRALAGSQFDPQCVAWFLNLDANDFEPVGPSVGHA